MNKELIERGIYSDNIPIIGTLNNKPVIEVTDACRYLFDKCGYKRDFEEVFYEIQSIKSWYHIVDEDYPDRLPVELFDKEIPYSKFKAL